MRAFSSRFLSLVLAAAVAGCGSPAVSELAKQDAPVENDAPLANLDALMAGAPANDEIPVEGTTASFALPAQFEISRYDSPVRSQGRRGVCSIFASVGLMEALYIKEGTIQNPDFSEQYLQWSAKNEVGSFKNTSGSNNTYNLRAISQFGIVTEEMDPYEVDQWGAAQDPECAPNAEGSDENLPTKCYTNGDPSPEARAAQKYFLPNSRYLSTSQIKNHIATNETPVAVGLTFFYQSWNHRKSELPVNSDYWRMGFVTYPNEADQEKSLAKRAGHAFIIVGWDDNLEVPMRDGEGTILMNEDGTAKREKGFYIFKNSWGTGNFGVNNPIGDGYGYISYRYVNEYGSAVVTGLPTNVPDPNPAVLKVFESTPAVEIPDNTPAGIESTIEVPEAGMIKALTVNVDVTHTYKGDLTVELVRGDKVIALHSKAGGSADDIKAAFALTDFLNTDMAGTWTLRVKDTASIDVGTLNAWSLEITK